MFRKSLKNLPKYIPDQAVIPIVAKLKLFGLNERVIEEERSKLKKTEEDRHEEAFEQWLLQEKSLLLHPH